MKLLVRWLASAAALLGVATLVPGVTVDGFGTALVASLAIGLINATIGAVVKLITTPIRWITLGLFTLVINAALFWLAAEFVSGFGVEAAGAAFLGAVVYGVLAWAIQSLVGVRGDTKKKT
ncbi:MAG: phage holin family protein [Bacteroidota bacterium]